MTRIDSHHHLWKYDPAGFAWIDDSMSALRHDFLPRELEPVLRAANVQGAIAVQAREAIEETQFLLDSARHTDKICAVVGWAPLASPDIEEVLDRFAEEKKLVGLREIAQGKPRGFFEEDNFDRGVSQLTARGLTYDLLIFENQLPEAVAFVDRHPNQRFVLDHAAKPKIHAQELEPWRTNIHDLAQRENVFCKISGLVTEAHWSNWSLVDLQPYLDVCVEAFSPQRLMAGSDWPVCLVATEYERWWTTLEAYFEAYSAEEKARIFGATALEFYGLSNPSAAGGRA